LNGFWVRFLRRFVDSFEKEDILSLYHFSLEIKVIVEAWTFKNDFIN
jgi:hypothetical protein